MKTSYEPGVVAWANEQAAFVRAGRFDLLDLEHIADEIEVVWAKAKTQAESETGLGVDTFPEVLPWAIDTEVLNDNWQPPDARS